MLTPPAGFVLLPSPETFDLPAVDFEEIHFLGEVFESVSGDSLFLEEGTGLAYLAGVFGSVELVFVEGSDGDLGPLDHPVRQLHRTFDSYIIE